MEAEEVGQGAEEEEEIEDQERHVTPTLGPVRGTDRRLWRSRNRSRKVKGEKVEPGVEGQQKDDKKMLLERFWNAFGGALARSYRPK